MILSHVFLLGLLLLAFLSWCSCVFLDYYDKNPLLFIWILSIFFVYLPLFINYQNEIIDINVVNNILLFSTLCHLVYLSSVVFFLGLLNKGNFRLKRENKNNDIGTLPIKIMYFFIGIVIVIFMINGIGISQILNANLLTKRELGLSSLLILFASSVVLAQFYYVIKSKSFLNITSYLIFFILITLFYKSRSIIILSLLPLIYYLIFYVSQKKYKVIVFLIGPLILIFSQLLRALRYQGGLSNFDSNKLWSDFSNNLQKLFTEGDFAVINVYFNIIRDCDYVDWCGKYTLLNSLSSLAFSFQGVKTLEYYLYDYYVSAGINGSLHPTSFGFLYGDAGGYLGCFFFIFLGLIRSYITVFIIDSKYFFIFNGFVMYFVLFFSRGSIYNSLIFLLISISIVSILNTIDNRKIFSTKNYNK